MRVLVLSEHKFIEKEIDNTLNALQKEVRGYIEIPYLSSELYNSGIDTIINEDGKSIDGLLPEIVLANKIGKIVDVVYGNIVFASHDGEGNTVGLSDEQISKIYDILKEINWLFVNNKGFTEVRVLRV